MEFERQSAQTFANLCSLALCRMETCRRVASSNPDCPIIYDDEDLYQDSEHSDDHYADDYEEPPSPATISLQRIEEQLAKEDRQSKAKFWKRAAGLTVAPLVLAVGLPVAIVGLAGSAIVSQRGKQHKKNPHHQRQYSAEIVSY